MMLNRIGKPSQDQIAVARGMSQSIRRFAQQCEFNKITGVLYRLTRRDVDPRLLQVRREGFEIVYGAMNPSIDQKAEALLSVPETGEINGVSYSDKLKELLTCISMSTGCGVAALALRSILKSRKRKKNG